MVLMCLLVNLLRNLLNKDQLMISKLMSFLLMLMVILMTKLSQLYLVSMMLKAKMYLRLKLMKLIF